MIKEQSWPSYHYAGDEGSLASAFSFLDWIVGYSVMLMTNNSSVIAYLKKQGHIISFSLYHLTRQIFIRQWSLPGRSWGGGGDFVTDQLSCRDQVILIEWSLLPWIFNEYVRTLEYSLQISLLQKTTIFWFKSLQFQIQWDTVQHSWDQMCSLHVHLLCLRSFGHQPVSLWFLYHQSGYIESGFYTCCLTNNWASATSHRLEPITAACEKNCTVHWTS